MEQSVAAEERRFKKGELVCKKGDFEAEMYDILYGSVAVYADYGTPEQQQVEELHAGEFLNVISFLETRVRRTTAVALEPTVVSVITQDNFGAFFEKKPAKIMQLLQNLSARLRNLTKDYLEVCSALEEHADIEQLKKTHGEWYEKHTQVYERVFQMVANRD